MRGRLVCNVRSAKVLFRTDKHETVVRWLKEVAGWTNKRLHAERAVGYAPYLRLLDMLEEHSERAATTIDVAQLRAQALTFERPRAVA